jgi:hypothetical protein
LGFDNFEEFAVSTPHLLNSPEEIIDAAIHGNLDRSVSAD